MIFFLNQCHSNVEKSGGQAIGQNNQKADLFCLISTTWDEQEKLGMEGQVALFYSKTLQVSGKLKQITDSCAAVLVLERDNHSEKRRMHDMNFYQQLLARVSSTKREQLV